MKLLVVIVTYNAMHWVKRCFDSLFSSTILPTVFVVDNGSTDGTQSYIQKNYSDVIFIQSKDNLGFGRANNLGLKYALENNYDYIYLLNQDAWVFPDVFEKLIKISLSNPEFGLISPMQMNADLYHIDKNFCVGLFKYHNKEFINDLYNDNLKEVYETTPFVMAAHWFLTNKCIKKVGGFSPVFKHYGEDNNYADRVKFHGFKIGVVPSVRVVHDREKRRDSPKKVMYLNYIVLLVLFSSPNIDKTALVRALAVCIYNGVKFVSLMPIVYFSKLLFCLVHIHRTKRVSMKTKCAFL